MVVDEWLASLAVNIYSESLSDRACVLCNRLISLHSFMILAILFGQNACIIDDKPFPGGCMLAIYFTYTKMSSLRMSGIYEAVSGEGQVGYQEKVLHQKVVEPWNKLPGAVAPSCRSSRCLDNALRYRD